jgi:hypothetical protein
LSKQYQIQWSKCKKPFTSHIDKKVFLTFLLTSLFLYIFTIWKCIVYYRLCRHGIYFDKILVSEYKLFKRANKANLCIAWSSSLFLRGRWRFRKCEAGEDSTIFVIRNNYLQLFGLGDSPFFWGHRFWESSLVYAIIYANIIWLNFYFMCVHLNLIFTWLEYEINAWNHWFFSKAFE